VEIIHVSGVDVAVGSHKGKNIVIGCDHRGFALKSGLLAVLRSEPVSITDVGCHSSQRCDYPDFSHMIGRAVSYEPLHTVGIAICGSGTGILIPAMKHQAVYGGLCWTVERAQLARQHNNTNLLALPANDVSLELAVDIVHAWLATSFAPDEPYLTRFVKTVRYEQEARITPLS